MEGEAAATALSRQVERAQGTPEHAQYAERLEDFLKNDYGRPEAGYEVMQYVMQHSQGDPLVAPIALVPSPVGITGGDAWGSVETELETGVEMLQEGDSDDVDSDDDRWVECGVVV